MRCSIFAMSASRCLCGRSLGLPCIRSSRFPWCLQGFPNQTTQKGVWLEFSTRTLPLAYPCSRSGDGRCGKWQRSLQVSTDDKIEVTKGVNKQHHLSHHSAPKPTSSRQRPSSKFMPVRSLSKLRNRSDTQPKGNLELRMHGISPTQRTCSCQWHGNMLHHITPVLRSHHANGGHGYVHNSAPLQVILCRLWVFGRTWKIIVLLSLIQTYLISMGDQCPKYRWAWLRLWVTSSWWATFGSCLTNAV